MIITNTNIMGENRTAKVTIKITEPNKEPIYRTPLITTSETDEDNHKVKAEALSNVKCEQNYSIETTFEVVDVEYIESFDDFLSRLK